MFRIFIIYQRFSIINQITKLFKYINFIEIRHEKRTTWSKENSERITKLVPSVRARRIRRTYNWSIDKKQINVIFYSKIYSEISTKKDQTDTIYTINHNIITQKWKKEKSHTIILKIKLYRIKK